MLTGPGIRVRVYCLFGFYGYDRGENVVRWKYSSAGAGLCCLVGCSVQGGLHTTMRRNQRDSTGSEIGCVNIILLTFPSIPLFRQRSTAPQKCGHLVYKSLPVRFSVFRVCSGLDLSWKLYFCWRWEGNFVDTSKNSAHSEETRLPVNYCFFYILLYLWQQQQSPLWLN